MAEGEDREWLKVLDPEELLEGRVQSVTCGHRSLCMTRYQGCPFSKCGCPRNS